MLALILIVLFVTLSTGLFAFGTAVLAPSSVLGARLRSLTGLRESPATPKLSERFEQAMDPLSRAIPVSPEEVSKTRALLIQAGYREPNHLTIFLGLRIFGAILFTVPVFLTGMFAKSPVMLLLLAMIGFIMPKFILKRWIKGRQFRIRLALPDALDLAIICVEAGLGLDQALQRVGSDLKHVHPELSDELELVTLEMRAGKARADALRNLALRTGVDDVRSLVAVLVQTDRFGTSIAQALRVHSDSLRTERRQRAEEAAAKTTIKMVPVLVFFVFPSMFAVVLGPAVIQMIRVLLPVVQK